MRLSILVVEFYLLSQSRWIMCREENKFRMRLKYTRRRFRIRVDDNVCAVSLSVRRDNANSFGAARWKRSRVCSYNKVFASEGIYLTVSRSISNSLKNTKLTRGGGWRDSLILQGGHSLDQAHKARTTLTEINSIVAKDAANSRCFARITNMAIGAIALVISQVSTAWISVQMLGL